MELDNLFSAILLLLLISILVIISIVIFVVMGGTFSQVSNTFNSEILADNNTAQTLSGTPTSLTATSYNQTWIDCDGTNDLITIPFNVSISFWYKNGTTDWQNVVNSSEDKTFVNGTDATPKLIPFYVSGDNYILCKTDATTFVNVSIDEIKIYNGFVNESTALEIYNGGR